MVFLELQTQEAAVVELLLILVAMLDGGNMAVMVDRGL
jgi:hypothetical protein